VLARRIERRGWCISLHDATPMQGDWRHWAELDMTDAKTIIHASQLRSSAVP
jgi:hypothetical protein